MAAVNHEIHDRQALALGVTVLHSESFVHGDIYMYMCYILSQSWLEKHTQWIMNESYTRIVHCGVCFFSTKSFCPYHLQLVQ